MEEYKKRMLDEFNELAERKNKLSMFINADPEFGQLDVVMKSLMEKQLTHMEGYLECLSERVHRLLTWDEIDAYNKNLLYMTPINNIKADCSAIDDIKKVIKFIKSLSVSGDRNEVVRMLAWCVTLLNKDIEVWKSFCNIKSEDAQ